MQKVLARALMPRPSPQKKDASARSCLRVWVAYKSSKVLSRSGVITLEIILRHGTPKHVP